MVEHFPRQGILPRYSRLTRFLLPLVAILVLLAGCDREICSCPPVFTEHLSAANSRPITGLDHTLLNIARNDYTNEGGAILSLASYEASDGTGYLLSVLDGILYAVPTANGQATLIRGIPCPGAGVALTANASQMACLGSLVTDQVALRPYGCFEVCFSEQLQITTFTPTVQPQENLKQTISDGSGLFSSPTWRPDGEVIAALEFANPPVDDVSSAGSASCAIALFAHTSTDSTDLVPALSLTVAGFSLCDAPQVAWSPDGQTLAVLVGQKLLILAAPSTATIASATHGGQFVKRVLTPRLSITLQQTARAMAWAPDGRSVAVLSRDQVTFRDQITQYSLDSSKPPLTLFGPTGYLGPIAYSADGRTLFFADGFREANTLPLRRPPAADGSAYRSGQFSVQVPQTALHPQVCLCPAPPAGLYAYTPPTL